MPSTYKDWTPERCARLAELFAAGKSDRQIAAEMRRTPCSIAKQRSKMGLLRPPGNGGGTKAKARRWRLVGKGFEVVREER